MHLDDNATVKDLLTKVFCTHPDILPLQNSLLVARNNEYAAPSEALTEVDIVDLMPTVSGG
jgi:molybdopterin converting factor small subunit